MKTKCPSLLCVLGVVFTMFVGAASASNFYTIVDNLGKRARGASLDVSLGTSVATGPVDVYFNVYTAQGGQAGLFSLATNANGFVSTTSFASL